MIQIQTGLTTCVGQFEGFRQGRDKIRFAFQIDPLGTGKAKLGAGPPGKGGKGPDGVVQAREAKQLGQDPGNTNEEEAELKKYPLVTHW